MFEKASEIRAAQREKIRERGRAEGRKEALDGVRERLQRAAAALEKDPTAGAVILTPEVMDYLLGEASGSSQSPCRAGSR